MAEAGLVRSKLFVVNAVLCQPPEGLPKTAMRRAVLCCRPVLLKQLEHLPIDIPTLAMGAAAFYALTLKERGVMLGRGFIRRTTRTIDEAQEVLRGKQNA